MNNKLNKISNPCTLVCKYDNEGLCIGCYRTKEEIANWPDYTEEEKKKIFELIVKRGGNPYKKKRYVD